MVNTGDRADAGAVGLVVSCRTCPDYEDWKFESWLLDFDTTSCVEFPEDHAFGYLYVLGLNDGWIKVGVTRAWQARLRALHRQVRQRHALRVEQCWKTAPLPADELRRTESMVKAYSRQLADTSRLTYPRGSGRRSRETEMFHGADFGMVRAYADVLGRCESDWWTGCFQ